MVTPFCCFVQILLSKLMIDVIAFILHLASRLFSQIMFYILEKVIQIYRGTSHAFVELCIACITITRFVILILLSYTIILTYVFIK